MIAHKEWLFDRNILLLLYRSLIRSKLDYDNFIYRFARMSLKTLDPIYHRGLRLVHATFRTYSIESQYVDANEAPAIIRSKKSASHYYVILKSYPENSTHGNTFFFLIPNAKRLFQNEREIHKIHKLLDGNNHWRSRRGFDWNLLDNHTWFFTLDYKEPKHKLNTL